VRLEPGIGGVAENGEKHRSFGSQPADRLLRVDEAFHDDAGGRCVERRRDRIAQRVE
jgi:hypothetical protein